MQLFLAGLNRTYTLDVEKDTTIEQLGFLIEDKTCIPRHLQKLQIPRLNLWLDDTTFDTINELKLKGGDTVRIYICQKNKNSGDRCKPNAGLVEKCAEARANPNGQLTRQRNNLSAVMKAAMETDWESIKHASSSLLGSESFLLSVAANEEENHGWKRNPNFLQYASSALQDNYQFVEQLVRYQISSYLSATERVQSMVFSTVCDVYVQKVNCKYSQDKYPEQKNLFTSITEISMLIQTAPKKNSDNWTCQVLRDELIVTNNNCSRSQGKLPTCNYINVSCLLDAISGNFLRQRKCLLPVIGNCRFDFFGVTGWWANLDQKCWLNQPWVEAILSSMKAAGKQQECVYAMHQVSSVVLQQPDFLKFIKESGIINIKFLNCYRKLYLKKRSIYDDLVTKLENEKIIVARSIALASPDIRGKCKIMSKWLQCAPSSLAHASPVLLGSKQFMTHVMELKLNETPGWSFFDASPSLMSDETFMLLGVKIHGRSALDHADISLLANLNFMRKIYANGCTIPPTFRLSEAPLSVRKDKECLVARVMVNPREVCLYASRMSLKNNICIAFSAVKINGAVLSLLPDCLKDHFNVARLAVQQDGAALSFVSARLRQNRVIVATALDVRVPELVKRAFLMACMIPCKVCPIFEKYCETVDCSGFSKTRKIMISRLMKYEHLRRSRSLLCSIGGIGRSVLMNIFEYAAFEPRRGTNILLNVDPEIASEWVEDMEAFYYAGALQSAGRVAF